MRVQRSYWELVNIGLVHWFLFGAEDIAVRGRIALTGPNGAGKSSILDAIKTVMTGRSGRHLELNSMVQTDRSDRTARRTVRDYCLGTVDDSEDGLTHVRDQALSYILLGFRHSGTGRFVTVGLCIAASSALPDEEIVARFIADGVLLRACDVSRGGQDADGSWTEAIPWDEVATRLRADPTAELRTETGPELFVKALCRALGPEDGAIDPHKFLRNLKNAAAFRPVNNTTEFVRGFILDAQPLNLGELRQSIARYKAVQQRIGELKQRIAEVDDLRDRGGKVRTRARTLALHRLSLAQGRIHLAAGEWTAARTERDETAGQLAEVTATLPSIEERLTARLAELDRARTLAAGSGAAMALEEARHRRRMLDERLAMLRERHASVARLIAEASACAPIVEPFNESAARRLRALDGPGGTAGLDADLAAAEEAVERALDAARDEVSAGQTELLAARANLARIESGQRVLGSNTQALLRLLESEGITATPLCDLVTGVEREWRQTVEAVLGEAREALILAPEDYEAGLRTYRRSGITGAQIINTTKSDGTRPARKNTLATVVTADDKHARAFLDFRLGAIVKVHTEAELRREDSAATADLMLASGRSTRKLRAPDRLLLGASTNTGIVEELETSIDEIADRLAEARQRAEQLRAAQRTLARLADDFGRLDMAGNVAALREMGELPAAISGCDEEIERIEADANDGLRERVEAAERAWRKAMAERDRANALQATLSERLSNRAEAVRRAQEADTVLRTEARGVVDANRELIGADEEQFALWWLGEAVPDAPDFSRSVSADTEAGEPRGGGADDGLEAGLKRVEFLIDYHHKRIESDRPNFVVRVGGYVNAHGLQRPAFLEEAVDGAPLDIFGAALAWVEREQAALSGQVLKDYEDRAGAAHDDAVAHFKGDFIGKMRGAFEAIQGRLRELNRQLAKRDFHGLTYRFEKREAAAYRDMIALIEASSTPDFDLVLSGATPAAGDRVAKAIRRLEEIALDPEASLEDLEDPRRYFEFDIAMDKDGVERTSMSKRLGTGSGGQVQVPFYVAICAALASTYYPDRHGLDGGMALSIFDEAFNRMDTAVIREVVNFMNDVGLQPFIAAPDKERATFMQFVDTVIGLSRVGTSVSLDVQYVKPYAHAEFARENPNLYGYNAFKAEAEKEAAE